MNRHAKHKTTKKSLQGFTLIEMVVSMAVFAVIAIACYSTMSAVLDGRQIISQKHGELSSLQRMHALMKSDFRYALNRSVRNGFGEPTDKEASLITNQDGEVFRLTALYPRAQNEGKLKRVSWVLDGKSVWRNEFSVLDRVQDTEQFKREIIEEIQLGVEQLNVYYFENDKGKITRKLDWDSTVSLPVAIEVELELSNEQRYRWLFGGSGL